MILFITAPKHDKQLCTTVWLCEQTKTIKCVSKSAKNVSLGWSINGTICSKISAMQLINFRPVALLQRMFKYGSNVIPWLTSNVGRTFASKCNVVTQLKTFLLSDASNFIISLTKPSASCWQANTTSFGGSFFGAFADRSISLSSFGVNICKEKNDSLEFRLYENAPY